MTDERLPGFKLLAREPAPVVEVPVMSPEVAEDVRALIVATPELRGEEGETGPQGEGGEQGSRGEPGRRGRRGEKGFVGTDGIGGRQGEIGAQGEPGERGPRGPRGAKGLKGDTGLAPDHEFSRTSLRFRKPDGTWGEFVDLRGPQGAGGGGRGRSAITGITDATLTGSDLVLIKEGLGQNIIVDLSPLIPATFSGLGIWRARTEIVAPPASGQLRFNNADPESATLLWVNETNDGGTDVGNFLNLLEAGDLIYIQERSTADNFIIVEISSNTDQGTYREFGISNVTQQGAALSQNTQVAVVVTIAGGGAAPPQRAWADGMSTRQLVYSDFTNWPTFLEDTGIRAVAAGVGARVTVPTIAYDYTNHPGVWGMFTGTTVNGRVFILSMASGLRGSWQVGLGGITRIGSWIQLGDLLSVPANRFQVRAGFSSATLPPGLLQGITFEYSDNENGGRWQAICHDGTETSVDTGVLVVALAYYKLEIEINAAGTSVEFFIDDISVATITTNIPSGLGFQHFYNSHIMKVTGLLDRDIYIDAYYVYQEITR